MLIRFILCVLSVIALGQPNRVPGFLGITFGEPKPGFVFPKLPKITNNCKKSIIVAVVDTGIDYTHPGLINNLWINEDEIPNNKIDDDKNGFVDDIIGWDFVYDTPLPFDAHGHGTHVSGLVLNGKKLNSNNNCVKIMALKYYGTSAWSYNNNLANMVKAFKYARNNGADIVNYSGGGRDTVNAERKVVRQMTNKGILLVAAAGNGGYDNDQVPYFPASYPFSRIISVASLDRGNEILSTSNYGIKSVDMAELGFRVLSYLPFGGRTGTMSGTSQATGLVSYAAALIMLKGFSALKTKNLLMGTVDKIPSLKNKVKSEGKVNVKKALIRISN